MCAATCRLSTLLPYLIVCIAVPWLLPQLNDLPAFSLPWEYVRQRVLSGKIYHPGRQHAVRRRIFLACEPVTQPARLSSRIIYGLLLGGAATVFRYNTVYETGICFALLIVGAFPEWLDRVARRAERMRFRKKEEKRRANRAKTGSHLNSPGATGRRILPAQKRTRTFPDRHHPAAFPPKCWKKPAARRLRARRRSRSRREAVAAAEEEARTPRD